MRLEVYSLPVRWNSKYDRLQFFGSRTVLQVHETGLTVEGLIPEVRFPILIRVIYRALSEWSLRTIPFSVISKCYIARRGQYRVFWTAMSAFGTLALTRSILWSEPMIAVVILAVVTIVTWLVSALVVRDYVHIEYRQPNGRSCAMRFRLRKSKDLQRLFQEIDRHRLHQSAPVLAKVADRLTNKRSWWQIRQRGGSSKV